MVDAITRRDYLKGMIKLSIDWDEVKDRRTKRGYASRVALAAGCNLHPQHLYKLEAMGIDPTLRTIAALCNGLQCTPNDIILQVEA